MNRLLLAALLAPVAAAIVADQPSKAIAARPFGTPVAGRPAAIAVPPACR
jgi:hypothetical protein